MKFFIPFSSDDEQAESVLDATSKFTGFPIPERRIYQIDYSHNGTKMRATVGEPADDYYREEGPVIALLKNESCLAICTKDRGVVRGTPIFVGPGLFAQRNRGYRQNG